MWRVSSCISTIKDLEHALGQEFRLTRGLEGAKAEKAVHAFTESEIEMLIPGNKQTGSHLGVIAQFHLYFDDLLPNSLGKPIVNWWN